MTRLLEVFIRAWIIDFSYKFFNFFGCYFNWFFLCYIKKNWNDKSLPRGIRYRTLPVRLVQGKAFFQHTWTFLQAFLCAGVHVYFQTCLKRFDLEILLSCEWVLTYVWVFYDSECIPFELACNLYVCELYFFLYVCNTVYVSVFCFSVVFNGFSVLFITN